MERNLQYRFSNYYFIIIWAVVFAAAIAYLQKPKPKVPTPSGWKIWEKTGALYTLIPYKKGVLAGGAKGIWYCDGNSTKVFAPGILPKGTVVKYILNSENRGLWIGHSNGLSIWYRKEWIHLNQKSGIPKPPIQTFVLDDSGGWIGGESGLVRFYGVLPDKKRGIKKILPNEKFDIYRISALMLDKYNNLWAGSSEAPHGGLFIITDSNITLWNKEKGLPHPQITSIIMDNREQIWVGTGFYNQGGAAVFKYYNGVPILKQKLLKNELAGPKVRSIMYDRDGFYWIGSERHGIAIRDSNKTIVILRKKQGLPSEEVTKAIQTKDGSIWLATLKGLVKIGKNVVHKYTHSH